VDLEEHVLHDVFGVGGVAEDAPGRAEDHRAVVVDDAVPVGHRLDLLTVR
jgi:hypothetical protein